MLLEVFDREDAPFLLWMAENPNGYVVNTERRRSSRLFFLHQSGCFHISSYDSGLQPNPFTARKYIKVCSNDANELLEWAAEHRPQVVGFSALCQTCDPESNAMIVVYPDRVDEAVTLSEGATRTVTINYYERNVVARRKCLGHWGFACKVCDLHFEERYGDIGKGFIHVHHLRPLSEISGEYVVDPINDLIPVCPNCHAMLHRRNPPYRIDELKDMLRR